MSPGLIPGTGLAKKMGIQSSMPDAKSISEGEQQARLRHLYLCEQNNLKLELDMLRHKLRCLQVYSDHHRELLTTEMFLSKV